MRVSDAERQVAAERLRGALAEGRLDFLEYDHRLAKAFEAVTYADWTSCSATCRSPAATSSAPAVAAAPARRRSPARCPPSAPGSPASRWR